MEPRVRPKLFYDSGTNTLTLQQPHLDDVIREDDVEIVLNNADQNQASSLVYNASCPNGKPTFTFQPEFLTNKIELTDTIGMLMQYPSIGLIGQAKNMGEQNAKSAEQMFELVSNCMYQIWEGEEVHECSDYTETEKVAFLESLNHWVLRI